MFTFNDICNIAVQIERNGEITYRRAGDAAQDPEIAATLAWMADQESQHAQWFESIRSTKPLTAEQREMEAVGKNLLQDMVKGNEFLLSQSELQRSESITDILEKSKAFEQDTIVFYNFLLDFVDDADSLLKMKHIIREEKNHIKELDRMEKLGSKERIGA
jgi:rubrerythrin